MKEVIIFVAMVTIVYLGVNTIVEGTKRAYHQIMD